MKEKYDEDYERRINLLAVCNIKTDKYKVFDFNARVIRRDKFPDLKEKERTRDENCLVIINRDGETIVITREFEQILRNAIKD